MTIKEFFSFKTNKCFWLNIIGMIALVVCLLFGVMEWLDRYTRHGEAVVVPDVKGKTVEQAIPLFRNQGLTCVVSDSTYVKRQPAGIILDVNPGIGQKVKEGRIIYLTINTLSVPLQKVPDVADNSSFRQAQAKLLAAGFKLDEVEEICGEKDWVYGVKYKGRTLNLGEEVPLGALLTLMVGNGLDEMAEGDSLNVDSAMGTGQIPTDDASAQEDSWF